MENPLKPEQIKKIQELIQTALDKEEEEDMEFELTSLLEDIGNTMDENVQDKNETYINTTDDLIDQKTDKEKVVILEKLKTLMEEEDITNDQIKAKFAELGLVKKVGGRKSLRKRRKSRRKRRKSRRKRRKSRRKRRKSRRKRRKSRRKRRK